TGFLGRDGGTFRAEIYEQVLAAEAQRQRIIGDRPAVRDEGRDDRIMIKVLCPHRRRASSLRARASVHRPDAGRTRFAGSGARITAFAKELRSDWQAGFSTLRPSCHAMVRSGEALAAHGPRRPHKSYAAGGSNRPSGRPSRRTHGPFGVPRGGSGRPAVQSIAGSGGSHLMGERTGGTWWGRGAAELPGGEEAGLEVRGGSGRGRGLTGALAL